MEILYKLFGSKERLQLIRLFLHHKDEQVNSSLILEKVKSNPDNLKYELAYLTNASFLNKGSTFVFTKTKSGAKAQAKKEVTVWSLNKSYPNLELLEALVFNYVNIDKKILMDRVKKHCKLKLFVLNGVFVNNDSEIDMLIVGESINNKKMEAELEKICSDLGQDLKYILMDIEEYNYRYKMYDKILRTLLDDNRNIIVANNIKRI